jgi:type II secretion system protein G
MKSRFSNKAFTLIELLVVIAIIGILSTVVLVSLNSARIKARDAKRLADFKQIQNALEMYYNDNNHYPVQQVASGGRLGGWENLESDLSPYINPLPRHPGTEPYYYDGGEDDDYGYGLMTCLENSSNYDLVRNDGGYYNPVDDGCYYEIGLEPAYDAQSGINWWLD